MLFFPLINVKMPTIVGIFTFMSRKNFMLNSKEFYNLWLSGPDITYSNMTHVANVKVFKFPVLMTSHVHVLLSTSASK